MVEFLLCKQDVSGSSPLTSTAVKAKTITAKLLISSLLTTANR